MSARFELVAELDADKLGPAIVALHQLGGVIRSHRFVEPEPAEPEPVEPDADDADMPLLQKRVLELMRHWRHGRDYMTSREVRIGLDLDKEIVTQALGQLRTKGKVAHVNDQRHTWKLT